MVLLGMDNSFFDALCLDLKNKFPGFLVTWTPDPPTIEIDTKHVFMVLFEYDGQDESLSLFTHMCLGEATKPLGVYENFDMRDPSSIEMIYERVKIIPQILKPITGLDATELDDRAAVLLQSITHNNFDDLRDDFDINKV